MTTTRNQCQAEGDEQCPNAACGICLHCSRNVCLDHSIEHQQLMNAYNRLVLNDCSEILTNLSTRFQASTIPEAIRETPIDKLQQWRTEAHRQVDEIFERKYCEIQSKIDEYQQIFDTIRNEKLEKINRYKQKIADLYRRSQITNKDISNIRGSIERIQDNLQIFDQHSIDILVNSPVTCSINIRMNVNNWKPSDHSSISSTSSSTSSIIRQLEFCLKYVSLSGVVSSHYILAHVNGTIADLIDQFILTQDKTSLANPRREFFLATEVSQDRLRRRFTNDTQLIKIFNTIDELVLYETPFELNMNNLQKYCLILCTFQDGLPWEMKLGLPILLKVPHLHCQGKDVIDELDKTLKKCFPFTMNQNQMSYAVKIASDNYQTGTTIILQEFADEFIDGYLSMADNATLIVSLTFDERTTMKNQSTHLARLDGIVKDSERRRRRSRK
ncbi:unnamed protein product [Adineta ricciae]|uniref:Uncharacterized protein n=1 Tax=Adineta ricciae TaxID=249248 RepID=A0A815HXI1_ADIRI|nr:unnamed protein product [Adineta ricciae]CAF1390695.1 unnamed protein product [Adineta ricciae]